MAIVIVKVIVRALAIVIGNGDSAANRSWP